MENSAIGELTQSPHLWATETLASLPALEGVISQKLRFIHLPGSELTWDGATQDSLSPGFWEHEVWRQKREGGVWGLRLKHKIPSGEKFSDGAQV